MTNFLEERDKAMVCKVIVFSFEIEHFIVKNLFFDDFMVYIIFICTFVLNFILGYDFSYFVFSYYFAE